MTQLHLNRKHESKGKKESVAVLLAAYNGAIFIQQQISTILKQKDVDIKIFISIDLSSDNTYKICNDLEKKNKSIILLPYKNKFGCAAKNFFHLINEVDFNNFDYIALSDQDDIWEKEKIYHAISQIKKFNVDGFSSDFIAFWENGKSEYIKKSWPQKKYDFLFESGGPGCTYVFKSSAINLFKKFLKKNWQAANQIKFHDWLIYSYFRSNNLKWRIDNLPLIKYRQHLNNEFGSNSNLKDFIKRFNLIREKWYINEIKKINMLLNQKINFNFFFIVKNIFQLRRRPRDSFVLLLLTLFGLFK